MPARVSLTVIVKNEAVILGRCLASVRDLVDETIIVDTGSSDNTKEIAQQHGARVFDLPWPNSFAAARNESIRHASAQWILWLDADEILDEANHPKCCQLFAGLRDDNTAFALKCVCVSGRAGGTPTDVDHVRLFRNHAALRWDYRVHEQILPTIKHAGHIVRFTDIAITHTGYTDPALRQKKPERNLQLLHQDLVAAAQRRRRAPARQHLIALYCDLGRLREAVAHSRAQAAESPEALHDAESRLLANGRLHTGSAH